MIIAILILLISYKNGKALIRIYSDRSFSIFCKIKEHLFIKLKHTKKYLFLQVKSRED